MKISRSKRALLAGVVLLFAATMLVVRAFPIWRGVEPLTAQLTWLLVGIAVGVPKGLFVISRSSKRIVARIEASPGPVWIWKTWPVYFYPLVGVMITAGVLFRRAFSATAPGLVSAVYVGVGAALAVGSYPYFRAMRTFAGAASGVE